MPTVLYVALTLVIAAFDSFFKDWGGYTAVNILLRVLVLLPLIFAVVKSIYRYARVLRRTLWVVMAADIRLPLFFPAGMGAFLVVHLLNAYNFSQSVDLRRDTLRSVVLPAVFALAVSLGLYGWFLYPSMDNLFRVLVGVYLVPIALAWGLSLSAWVQTRSRWSVLAGLGMFLFYCTDFQVAAEFLTDIAIPAYGVVNALSYYGGLLLLGLAARSLGASDLGAG